MAQGQTVQIRCGEKDCGRVAAEAIVEPGKGLPLGIALLAVNWLSTHKLETGHSAGPVIVNADLNAPLPTS